MPSVKENPEISLRDVQAAFKGLLKSGGPITMGAEIAAVFASTLMMPLEKLIDVESEKILGPTTKERAAQGLASLCSCRPK